MTIPMTPEEFDRCFNNPQIVCVAVEEIENYQQPNESRTLHTFGRHEYEKYKALVEGW